LPAMDGPELGATACADAHSIACTGIPAAVLPRQAFPDVQVDDLRLWAPSWWRTLVASSVIAVLLFLGLLLIGLAEQMRLGPGPVMVTMRWAAWTLMYFFPISVVSSNIVGYCLLGISIPEGPAAMFMALGMERQKLAQCAAATGGSVQKLYCVPLFFNGVSLITMSVALAVPLPGNRQYLGLILVYCLAGNLPRWAVGNNLFRLFPPQPGGTKYFTAVLQIQFFGVIGFFLVCAVNGLMQRFLGPWIGVQMVVAIGLYEIFGVCLVQVKFTRTFAMSRETSLRYAGTEQGLIPSLNVSLIHCNAEVARMVLLLSGMTDDNAMLLLPITLTGTLVWNLLVRTKWMLGLTRLLIGDAITNSNMFELLLRAKFQMGYPRFLAWAAVLLARLCLGTLRHLDPRVALAGGLLLLVEVVEDALSSAAPHLGVCCDLPFPPPLQAKDVAKRANERARATAACTTSTPPRRCFRRCCCARRRKPTVTPTADIYRSEKAKNLANATVEILQGHTFKYSGESFRVMPLWAHLAAVFFGQLHLVICLIIFDNGMPYLLGLCTQPGYTGIGRGLIWWPTLEGNDACSGP